MKKFFEDFKDIIIALFTAIFSLFLSTIKSDENQLAITITVIAIIVCLFIYLILSKIFQNNNLSNTAVIRKSKKYTKYLSKLASVNRRTIKKYYDKSNMIKKSIQNENVIALSKGIDLISKDKEKKENIKNKNNDVVNNYYHNVHIKYVTPEILNARSQTVKYLNDKNHAIDIFDSFYDSIHDLSRILLQLEQHTLRIKLGKYVIDCTSDIDKAIYAYVDLIGYTYILLGNVKKGISYIEKGICLIDFELKNSEEGSDDYYRYLLLKARALRHIGTYYYTIKYHDKDKVKNATLDAIRLIDKPEVYDYHIKNNKVGDLLKMLYGLKYNKLLYDYSESIKAKNVTTKRLIELLEKVKEIEGACEEGVVLSDGKTYILDDKHRHIKALTLKNQINTNLYFLSGQNYHQSNCDAWFREFKGDLRAIEKTLDANIYFDEAMETYICQKVQFLYDYIGSLFEGDY